MKIEALNCPNCGAPFQPEQKNCAYCGSYIIVSEENYVDLSNVAIHTEIKQQKKYPGVYVYGRLLGQGEKPLALGAANFSSGLVSTGGKLLLTTESLSFSAHAFNIGEKAVTIPLKQVTEVKMGSNFLISQSILVSTPQQQYKFVVYHGKEWVAKIEAARREV